MPTGLRRLVHLQRDLDSVRDRHPQVAQLDPCVVAGHLGTIEMRSRLNGVSGSQSSDSATVAAVASASSLGRDAGMPSAPVSATGRSVSSLARLRPKKSHVASSSPVGQRSFSLRRRGQAPEAATGSVSSVSPGCPGANRPPPTAPLRRWTTNWADWIAAADLKALGGIKVDQVDEDPSPR